MNTLVERIDEIMKEADQKPLSLLLPQTIPIMLECRNFEGYCLLSFWMKPKNKENVNDMFGFNLVTTMMEEGLSQEEAKQVFEKSLRTYTNEILIGKDQAYGASVFEMEDLLKTYEQMIESMGVDDTSIVMQCRHNVQFFYATLRNDMMTHLSKCRVYCTREGSYMSENRKREKTNCVFIVHGHDHAALAEVEAFVGQTQYEPIVVFKETSGGRTIIEKLERYLQASFAIVLYTECDEGKAKEEKKYQFRARQNVVFEHGLLTGALGREHIVALVKGAVEIPSDLDGLVFINMDQNGAWKYAVAREMQENGMNVDLNQIK